MLGAVTAPLIRVAGGEDLPRIVEFQNRDARPAFVQSVAVAQRFEKGNPQPNRLLLVAEDGGAIVAVAQVGDGGVFAAPDGAYRAQVRVAPAARRRGLGRELLGRLEAHVRAKRAPKVTGSVLGHEPDGLRFAERNGYREFHRRFTSYVDVAAFDPRRFDDPQAVARRAGVEIAPYGPIEAAAADRIELQRDVYRVIAATGADVPRPEPVPPPPPFEKVRPIYFEGDTFDRGSSVVALRDGRCVGVTITTINPAGVAYTAYTGVDRAERGKGIALALKLTALAQLKARGATLFGTTNDEANAAMRGINARLGYVADPPQIEVEKVFEA